MNDATTSVAVPQTSAAASTPLSRSAAYAMLVALVVIWGLNWPIMKLVVHAMPPLWFVVTRLTVGAACLFAFLLVTGRLATPRAPTGRSSSRCRCSRCGCSSG